MKTALVILVLVAVVIALRAYILKLEREFRQRKMNRYLNNQREKENR